MDEKKVALISIIVPVYKVEEYLAACIDSICSQTYPHLEILLVDDGSPDRCGSMCDAYATRDSRIKVIHKENGGLSDARNAGLEKVTGDYVIFVDSDDWIAPDYVEKSLNLAMRYQADIVACDFLETEDDKKERESIESASTAPVVVLTQEEALLAWLYRKYYGVTAWAKMYSRRCVQGVCFPVGKLHEDVGTTYRIFLQAERTVYLDEKLYYYRQRAGSIVNSGFNHHRLDYLEFTREIMSCMQVEYPEYYPAAICRHFQGCIQIAIAQKKPEYWLLKEIRTYAPTVVRDSQARGIYRLLAIASLLSPQLTVKLAGMFK